jgi:hypothetical protein
MGDDIGTRLSNMTKFMALLYIGSCGSDTGSYRPVLLLISLIITQFATAGEN